MTKRAHWPTFIVGSNGSESLKGSAGRDVIAGRNGNDWIHGGDGNDIVYGDGVSGGKHWGCLLGGWWHSRGGGDDTLNGGAGSDLVFGGKGNDFFLYSMAENLGAGFADVGAHDVHDGGKGFDTLKLQLTYGEYRLDAVQQDIAAFESFLARKANPHGEHGKTFHFQTFDLDARNFEALVIERVNTGPAAGDDAAATDENTPLSFAPASLLGNDSDADHLDQLAVIDADALSARGAEITLGADASLVYDPVDALELQQLAEGVTIVDSFSYTIADLGGANATATVQVTVTGVNDLPVAEHDVVTVPVVAGGGGGQPGVRTITFEGAQDASNVDGFRFAGFSISEIFGEGSFFSYMAYAGTTNNNAGGDGDADGAVRYGSDGQEFGVLSLSIASMFIEPVVTLVGYRDGEEVAGAKEILELGALYKPQSFGGAWSSIDELRFYGANGDGSLDYILIDNLQVALSGGGGTPTAQPVDIDVLANDIDIDSGDVLALLTFDDTSAMGALITRNTNGTLHYDPSGVDLPVLAPGEKVFDTFEYTVSDGHGGTSVASVSVELLGADDASLLGLLGAPDVDLL